MHFISCPILQVTLSISLSAALTLASSSSSTSPSLSTITSAASMDCPPEADPKYATAGSCLESVASAYASCSEVVCGCASQTEYYSCWDLWCPGYSSKALALVPSSEASDYSLSQEICSHTATIPSYFTKGAAGDGGIAPITSAMTSATRTANAGSAASGTSAASRREPRLGFVEAALVGFLAFVYC